MSNTVYIQTCFLFQVNVLLQAAPIQTHHASFPGNIMMTPLCTMDVQIPVDGAGGIGAPPPEMENLSVIVGSGVHATLPYLNAQLVRLQLNSIECVTCKLRYEKSYSLNNLVR